MPRPFIVLDHISFGVQSLAGCAEYLEDQLGGVLHEGGPNGPFTWAQWTFAHGARIELIEPLGADGFLHRFVAAHGPGLHHVTFKVPDLVRCAARAKELGYTVTGYDDSMPDWKECFLHPKQALGVVIQMAEHHPELGTTQHPGWRPNYPSAVRPPAPPPATIAELCLSAPDETAVLRQYRDLLQGQADKREGGWSFTWPESPHRITVRIDPHRAAGPIQVNVRADRELAACPTALFGIPTVQIRH